MDSFRMKDVTTFYLMDNMSLILTQETLTYSKSTKETVERNVKYVQN